MFLVTGATGFVGKQLVDHLLNAKHRVRVLGRSLEKTKSFFGNAVEFHLWTSEKNVLPPKVFDGIQTIVHLSGEPIDKRWTATQKQRILNSRILSTRNLVTAVNALESFPSTFISASAVGIYGDRGDEILTEESGSGQGFLADVCRQWEEELFQTKKEIRTVALRFGVVLGGSGGALKRLLPIFKAGLGGAIGEGKQWMSWIHVQDLVRLIATTADEKHYRSSINATVPNPVTNADFANALGRALDKPVLLRVPSFAMRLIMGEGANLILSSQRVIPKVAVKNRFVFRFDTIDKALHDIVKERNPA